MNKEPIDTCPVCDNPTHECLCIKCEWCGRPMTWDELEHWLGKKKDICNLCVRGWINRVKNPVKGLKMDFARECIEKVGDPDGTY